MIALSEHVGPSISFMGYVHCVYIDQIKVSHFQLVERDLKQLLNIDI